MKMSIQYINLWKFFEIWLFRKQQENIFGD